MEIGNKDLTDEQKASHKEKSRLWIRKLNRIVGKIKKPA